jgi:uncharacterized SAM-binding protein YcdF (DUF218 family)
MRYSDPLLPLALAFAVVSLFRAWGRSKERHWMLTLSIASLLVISSTPLAAVFSKPLETRYDGRHFIDNGEAIVILSGACNVSDPYRRYTSLAPDSYDRTLSAVWLYHSRQPRPMLVTGSRCALAMARLLESQGVASELILQEQRATNTHENAVYSAEILRANRISAVVLVTDAKSMLRAELSFRKAGFPVIPYPVGLETWKFEFSQWIPSWQAIRANGDTLHEFMGLLWYRWRGWI